MKTIISFSFLCCSVLVLDASTGDANEPPVVECSRILVSASEVGAIRPLSRQSRRDSIPAFYRGSISADGSYYAFPSSPTSIHIYRSSDSLLFKVLNGPPTAAPEIFFSRNGERLFSHRGVSRNSRSRYIAWDVGSGNVLSRFLVGRGAAGLGTDEDIALSGDGRYGAFVMAPSQRSEWEGTVSHSLASTGAYQLRVVNIDSRRVVASISSDYLGENTRITMSVGGEWILAIYSERFADHGTAALFRFADQRLTFVSEIRGFPGLGEDLLSAVTWEQMIEDRMPEFLWRGMMEDSLRIRSVQFTNDDSSILVLYERGRDDRLMTINVETRTVTQETILNREHRFTQMITSQDGQVLILGGRGVIQIMDRSGTVLHVLTGVEGFVDGLGYDATHRVVRAATGNERGEMIQEWQLPE